MKKFAGKKVFISGGATGIGRAAAFLFARQGAVVTIFDWDVDNGEKCIQEILAAGGNGIFLSGRLRNGISDGGKPSGGMYLMASSHTYYEKIGWQCYC